MVSQADARVAVQVAPLPSWVDLDRLLGPAPFQCVPIEQGRCALGSLSVADAAGLAARLRGLGLDGHPLNVQVTPALSRAVVRKARLEDARARRHTTPGFLRTSARASDAGRYSLTPEVLALALGKLASRRSVVDAGCGSGGNTLGFARMGSEVTALDLDAQRISEAQHNARVYGVSAQVKFENVDALAALGRLSADILFLDPPWGEHYDKRRTTRADFPLLDQILTLPLGHFRELWVKVPASFVTASVPGAEPSAWFGEAVGDYRRIKFVLLRRVLR